MKTIIGALAALIIFVGCQSPVPVVKETRKTYVVNSLWQVVKVVESSAREVVSDDLNQEIEAYNAETLDDFLRVYVDEVPDLSEAPLVSVFIVNPETYEVNSSATNITRQQLIDDIAIWRASSYGQILFIDHVPPAPVVTPPPSMYAWYALYLVDGNGQILYEDHCGWTEAEVWDGQWILDGGWRDVDHYYETTLRAYQSMVPSNPGWALVTRQLYTPLVTP